MDGILRALLRPLDAVARRDRTDKPLRLALVGTPRSGNTWLRRLITTAYALEGGRGRELAVHDPTHVDWYALGSRFIVQVHLPREPRWVELFDRLDARVVVPSRHPFDVLISILHYATRVHDTHLWLFGKGGDESSIRGLHPCHPGFLEYARGPRAAALLGVSPAWRETPGAVAVRYEDLVGSPATTLHRLAGTLGQSPPVGWDLAREENTIDRLRVQHGASHHWQGKPGLWRSLLTTEAAEAIAQAHRPLLDADQDIVAADPNLTPEQALANWEALG